MVTKGRHATTSLFAMSVSMCKIRNVKIFVGFHSRQSILYRVKKQTLKLWKQCTYTAHILKFKAKV